MFSLHSKGGIMMNKLEISLNYTNNKTKLHLDKKNFLCDIKNGRYHMFLQPIFDFRGNIVKSEGLVRYISNSGIILPNEFVPILENLDLIFHLDIFVFEEACKILNKWRNENIQLHSICLNFSRKTLMNENLVEQLEDIRIKNQISIEYLILEITESARIADTSKEKDIVFKLYQVGYILSLDDFGMGYSNIKSFITLPYTYIKLDKGLIDDLEINSKGRLFMKCLIELFHQLGIKVVSEGIENEYQYKFLLKCNCDMAQGYFIGAPLNLYEFELKYCKKSQ